MVVIYFDRYVLTTNKFFIIDVKCVFYHSHTIVRVVLSCFHFWIKYLSAPFVFFGVLFSDAKMRVSEHLWCFSFDHFFCFKFMKLSNYWPWSCLVSSISP